MNEKEGECCATAFLFYLDEEKIWCDQFDKQFYKPSQRTKKMIVKMNACNVSATGSITPKA